MLRRTCGPLIALLLMMGPASAVPAVDFTGLVSELTDLSVLARKPLPAYTCKQFSSYDRRSTDPGEQTDENWYANGDAAQFIREEERNGAPELVLMDTDGPGAIVRFWSANADAAGVIRVYLDGAETPAIEMPLTNMLNGSTAPFVEGIAGVRSRGWNSHLPIPYAKHCKVTASERGFYYQINYRTYQEGTPVKTFTMAEAMAALDKVEAAAALLKNPVDPHGTASGAVPEQAFRTTLAAGERSETYRAAGPGEVLRLVARVEAEDLPTALRACVIQLDFDGEAAVRVPLGDFFGTAPGINAFQSLPCGVTDDGMLYSNWVMPFRSDAALTLVNHSDAPVTIGMRAYWRKAPWREDNLYFHAGWRGEQDIPTRPRQDWTFLEVAGAGRFVGDMMHVTNPTPAWWGEGDEKIYVDGETFPSTFGTGTEDYFGYAWCNPEPFTHAYHNQPRCDGPGNFGQTCVSRYHIIDNIPFTKALKFDMEVWHWAEVDLSQSAVSFWYAAAGATDTFAPLTKENLVLPATPEPKHVEGALEGEDFRLIEMTGGNETTQSGGWDWSGNGQRWWTHAAVGQTLALGFPVEKAGRYDVVAVFTKAPDYGVMKLSINGKPCAGTWDFFNPGNVIIAPETSLGVFDLTKGENVLKAEVLEPNPEAAPGNMLGLDYLLIKPAK